MTVEAYEYFRNKGLALAGAPDDFAVRAVLYHQLYQDSGKRNVFALIAAHGTLWGAGYFKRGLLGAWLLSLPYMLAPQARKAKLRTVNEFADSFRDINRRVCAESYAIYHYTKVFGGTCFIRAAIGDELADMLCACHAASQSGTAFSAAQRERLFAAYFNWEQDKVVAPFVTQAFAQIDWLPVKFMALRPNIAFSFLDRSCKAQFSNFASQDERVLLGMRLYRKAEQVGLDHAERCLDRYKLTPLAFERAAAGYCCNSLRNV
jgi:hypothetical protein